MIVTGGDNRGEIGGGIKPEGAFSQESRASITATHMKLQSDYHASSIYSENNKFHDQKNVFSILLSHLE